MVFPFLFHLVGLELQFFCFFSSVFCVSITNSSSTYSNNSETMAKYDFYIMICKYLAGLFPLLSGATLSHFILDGYSQHCGIVVPQTSLAHDPNSGPCFLDSVLFMFD